MPQAIVDVLETVQIHEQQSHVLVVAARTRNRLIQSLLQHAPVRQAGQRVVLGHVLQFFAVVAQRHHLLRNLVLHALEAASQITDLVIARQRQPGFSLALRKLASRQIDGVDGPRHGACEQHGHHDTTCRKQTYDGQYFRARSADLLQHRSQRLSQTQQEPLLVRRYLQPATHKGGDQRRTRGHVSRLEQHFFHAAFNQRACRLKLFLNENAAALVKTKSPGTVRVYQHVALGVRQEQLEAARQVSRQQPEYGPQINVHHHHTQRRLTLLPHHGHGQHDGRFVHVERGATLVVDGNA